MFKKAAIFGDIHFGKRSDSPTHNQDCLDFIDWFCQNAQEHEVDQIIFLGDWFDNRSRLRLDTIDSGNQAMRKLRQVAPVTMILGNHDLFFRNNRSVHSIDAYREWDNVTIIDEITLMDGVGFVPWLVGTEYLEVADLDATYLMGHFELPYFLMNSTVEMPDRGGMNANQFTNPELVLSGHFHKRQLKKNVNKIPVWYIGNPFGHDFNDVGDEERGMTILEWGQDPVFIDYTTGPLYQRFTTSEIVELIESDLLGKRTRSTSILEVKDDVGLELEDISVIREELANHVREARVYQGTTNPGVDAETSVDEMDNKRLDEIVVEHLLQIDPRGSDINPDTLVELFKGEKDA